MAEVQRLGENPLRLPRRRWELPALALCVLTLASVFADPAGAQSSGSMGSESDVTARISIVVPERATFTIGLVDTVYLLDERLKLRDRSGIVPMCGQVEADLHFGSGSVLVIGVPVDELLRKPVRCIEPLCFLIRQK